MAKLVTKLLGKGAICQCDSTQGQFLSGIFLVPKPDSSSRFILNLKKLNDFIRSEHFKLEDRKTVINFLSEGCFMAKIDLKAAYYSIPIAESDQKFSSIQFEGQLYEFTCIPFGLTTAPYVFTKLLKPVVVSLRRQGYISVTYIDAYLLIGRFFEECQENVRVTYSLLQKLGLTINDEKCHLIPTNRCKYIGFLFDSLSINIELPREKRLKVKQLAFRYSRIERCKIRDFSEFVGTVVSCCPAVRYGLGHTKAFERARSLALE